MGTPGYMSPEQARGKPVDKRTDIWAFGAVLYQMFTGRAAFEGETFSDTIALVLQQEPDWNSVPFAARHLVQRCLEKDPKRRLRDIGDALWELDRIEHFKSPQAGDARTTRSKMPVWKRLSLAAVALVVIAAVAIPASHYLERPISSQTSKFEIQTSLMTNPYQVSISPDGGTVAYVAAVQNGKRALFVRQIDSVVAQSLPGTEGAIVAFWSPDSQYIGYSDEANRKLRKVSVRGGPPQSITDSPYNGRFVPVGTWNSDGTIIFGNGLADQPLYRVSAAGGRAKQITMLNSDLQEAGHAWPYFLPDGRHFLFLAWSSKAENRAIYVGSLDSNARTRLMSAESMPVYAPPGFLLFLREGNLFAQKFVTRNAHKTFGCFRWMGIGNLSSFHKPSSQDLWLTCLRTVIGLPMLLAKMVGVMCTSRVSLRQDASFKSQRTEASILSGEATIRSFSM